MRDLWGESSIDPRDELNTRLDESRAQTALAAALRELDPEIRTAIKLRFHDGLSFEEMAARSGEKAGTLQARVSRALAKLQRQVRNVQRGREADNDRRAAVA